MNNFIAFYLKPPYLLSYSFSLLKHKFRPQELLLMFISCLSSSRWNKRSEERIVNHHIFLESNSAALIYRKSIISCNGNNINDLNINKKICSLDTQLKITYAYILLFSQISNGHLLSITISSSLFIWPRSAHCYSFSTSTFPSSLPPYFFGKRPSLTNAGAIPNKREHFLGKQA